MELGQHNEDLHTTRKSEKVQSDGRASGAVRYEVIQRCLRDGACSCLSGVLGAVSMERPTRTHAGKARVAKESKAMGARCGRDPCTWSCSSQMPARRCDEEADALNLHM